jgi:hypothetical protein
LSIGDKYFCISLVVRLLVKLNGNFSQNPFCMKPTDIGKTEPLGRGRGVLE